MFNITSDQLKLGSTLLTAKAVRQSSKAAMIAGGFTADRLLSNARAAEAKAQREAKLFYEKGDTMVSDAIAAMATQGAAIDPTILAKIKAKMSTNAMNALFEGRARSEDLTQQAIDTRYSAGMGRAASLYKSSISMLTANTSIIKQGANSFAEWMKNNNRPSGWKASPF